MTVMQSARNAREKHKAYLEAQRAATRQYHEELNEEATDTLLADITENGGIQCNIDPDHSGEPIPVGGPLVTMHPATWARLAGKASAKGYKIKNRFIWKPTSGK